MQLLFHMFTKAILRGKPILSSLFFYVLSLTPLRALAQPECVSGGAEAAQDCARFISMCHEPESLDRHAGWVFSRLIGLSFLVILCHLDEKPWQERLFLVKTVLSEGIAASERAAQSDSPWKPSEMRACTAQTLTIQMRMCHACCMNSYAWLCVVQGKKQEQGACGRHVPCP